ncbi:MAG TPA: substrate-binding domain-containing protein [Fimbriimonadaceae bacterium]|nr:substrate-binding domain-containing protein [Fimbriimonadaceae bacterium]
MPLNFYRLTPVVLALIVSFGCSSTEPQTDSGPTPVAGAKMKLVFIPKSTGNPYFNQVAKGFEGASGIEFSSQAPATADATSQLAIIKEQVQRGVNAIALSANSPDALNEALDQAKAKGVMVLTVDSDLTGNESHRDVGILPTNFKKIGPAQIELLGSQIGYEGEFAILSATTDAPNQNAWIETMKTELKNPKYAKMKLVEIVYGDDEPQKSSTEAEALLTKHPKLRGIISPTSVGLAAAAQVLDNSGLYPGGAKATGQGIVLTGLSTPNQMKKFVEKGVVASFQLWDPADMGVIATHIASNKLTLKPGDSFEVPGKGKFTVEENNVVYAGQLLTFNKENIGKYDF